MLEGDLDDFTLPEVLQLLGSTRKSGTLTLHGPAAAGRLDLAGGEIVEVSADVAQVGVARRLLGQGLVGSAPIEDALRAADRLPGDRRLLTQLVAREALSVELAAEVGRDQAIDQLAVLLAWEQGSFRFDRDQTVGEGLAVDIGLNTDELVAAATARRDALGRIAALEAAHHPGAVIDLPAAETAGSRDQAVTPRRAEPAAGRTESAPRATLDADAARGDDGAASADRPLVTTVRAERLRTDPTIDEDLVSRLIAGVKEL